MVFDKVGPLEARTSKFGGVTGARRRPPPAQPVKTTTKTSKMTEKLASLPVVLCAANPRCLETAVIPEQNSLSE